MTVEAFASILRCLVGPGSAAAGLPLWDPGPWLARDGGGGSGPDASQREAASAALTAAFLVALGGASHPAHERATAVLADPPPDAPEGLAQLYRDGIVSIPREVARASAADAQLAATLRASALWLAAAAAAGAPAERAAAVARAAAHRAAVAGALWAVFFPEGVGIRGHEEARIAALREARTVRVQELAGDPIGDPARESLFTSNVLLTVPSERTPIGGLPYPESLRHDLALAAGEPQRFWYDHPIQIGVEPSNNELLYGLRNLDEAVAFERERRPGTGHATCLLSVSVTHAGLQRIARPYVEEVLARSGGLRHLDVLVFTEADAARLVDEVLAPSAPGEERALLREVVGVDGPYGRHYSFLKAIAALWHVLVDPAVRATFKIDLDQVFPQAELVDQTGASAFEHMGTPLWGARGVDARGREVELGMVAGALVNERDIGRGLFTPDVDYPPAPHALHEYVFQSALPQALSTRAEMMARDDGAAGDRGVTCLERVHVTGGTNGIRVDALRRHRPFTPSFIGRAEDQAYILSTLGAPGPRLAYAHAAGLIMRHDKEAFAGEAIEAARVGRVLGDDIRILQFSAYADAVAPSAGRALAGGGDPVKALLDPFTGCFISRLPVTVALLRFALRVADAFATGHPALGADLAENGAPRLADALRSTGDTAAFRAVVDRERLGWDLFYDALDALEDALRRDDPEALERQRRARAIVDGTRVRRR